MNPPTRKKRALPATDKPAPGGARMENTSAKGAIPGVIDTPGSSPALDTRYLESLLGYNARRAALSVIGLFLQRMAPFDLRPVDFSVLTLIAHNPGATSRQICAALDILPPNLVSMVKSLERRDLIERRAHPTDGRALGLYLTPEGQALQHQAQATATRLEQHAAGALSTAELQTLKRLLRKVYQR